MTALRSIGAALVVALAAACSAAPNDDAASGDPQTSDLVGDFEVEPSAVIGTGNPGNGDEDLNPPDGVIFDVNGNLLLTDAMNHRVQVWDPKKPRKLGQFGSPEIFHGEVVDLAQSPTNGQVIVTDETAHVAYAFTPPTGHEEGDAKYTSYTFTGTDMFTTEVVKKVGGITFDSKGRIYTVDARQNLVRRYDATGKLDPTFKFAENGSVAYLHGCEGIAVDEKRGNLYVSSEFDSVIQVFDLEDGSYKKHMIGARPDPDHVGARGGASLFPAAIEGLWILDDYLLASDEADGGEGHLKIFDLREESVFDSGPEDYAKLKEENKPSGYVGSFGSFCSPDSVAAFTDASGESLVAIADQCHYKVVVYTWSAIQKAGKFGRK